MDVPARRDPRLLLAALLLLACAAAILLQGRPARAQEGWTIERFDAALVVQPDGTVDVTETIAVDFGTLERHGIFRDLRVKVPYDGDSPACEHKCSRIYGIEFAGATRNGQPEQAERSGGDILRIHLGDPDVTISGPQVYELRYTIHGALNHIGATDELFWNVTGTWEAPIEATSIDLRFADGVGEGEIPLQAACFQGYEGSTEDCPATVEPRGITYSSGRTLSSGEQMTIVAGWPAGLVRVDPPFLEEEPGIWDYFTFDWLEWGGLAVLGVIAAGAIGRLWWLFGRDREYTSIFYLTENPEQQTRPLFGRREVVIEYLPPEDLRPAQMGLLLDERADTLDVTATIIDLAVRGYLEITEIKPDGMFSWFKNTDWRLNKLKAAGDEMLPYERKLFNAIFRNRDEVLLSDLKTTFHERLAEVKDALYKDAMERGWFRWNPDKARNTWRIIGVGLMLAGVGLCILSALYLSRGLIFIPVAVAGLVLLIGAGMMPRRTAKGSEALRRILGFRRYVAEGEQRLHEFHEEQGIFARYLPYAIVFGSVDLWAKRFRDMGADTDEAITWYHGTTPLRAAALSSHLNAFSSSMSSAMSSTPGGSGGSGFSGGSAGGGGGGGGGGSW